MNKQAVFAAVAICLLSVAFTQNSTELENHGVVVANMDRSVKPGDDFYQYANGAWIERTQLPGSGTSRSVIKQDNFGCWKLVLTGQPTPTTRRCPMTRFGD